VVNEVLVDERKVVNEVPVDESNVVNEVSMEERNVNYGAQTTNEYNG